MLVFIEEILNVLLRGFRSNWDPNYLLELLVHFVVRLYMNVPKKYYVGSKIKDNHGLSYAENLGGGQSDVKKSERQW